MDTEILKDEYLKFPDRSDFVPIVDGNGEVKFLYNGEGGLKKARLLSLFTGTNGEFEEVERAVILEKLEEYFGDEATDDYEDSGVQDLEDVSDILSASYEDAPVIKLVNQIIINSVKGGSSDIHFESRENAFLVRFRIDGKLRTYKRYQKICMIL